MLWLARAPLPRREIAVGFHPWCPFQNTEELYVDGYVPSYPDGERPGQ
jgi:hypothetical protein